MGITSSKPLTTYMSLAYYYITSVSFFGIAGDREDSSISDVIMME